MTIPSIRSSSTGTDGANATTRNLTYPATISAGDLLVLVIQSDGDNLTSPPATPSGWTSKFQIPNAGGDQLWYGQVFAKVADGTEDGTTFAFDTNEGVGERCIWCIAAVNVNGTATTGLLTGTADETIAANAPNPPNHSTTSGDRLWVGVVMGDGSGTWTSSPTPEAGGSFTDLYRVNGATTTGPFWVGTYDPGAASSSQNPVVGVCSAGVEVGITLSVLTAEATGVTITDAGDELFLDGELGIVITGTAFGASQGGGSVKISPTDNVADGSAVTQTVTSWADTSITITAVKGALALNTTLYLFVTNNASQSNASGHAVQFKPLPEHMRHFGVQGYQRTLVTM